MKWRFVSVFILALARIGMAQPECRQADAISARRYATFTVYQVSLPSQKGIVQAEAFVPNTRQVVRGVVFSFSALSSDVMGATKKTVTATPVAQEVAEHGRAAIVIQRDLTWPIIDASVGKMQTAVLCAEQWLSTHAAIKPDDWLFVGPKSDQPTFEQLKAVGDERSVTKKASVARISSADPPRRVSSSACGKRFAISRRRANRKERITSHLPTNRTFTKHKRVSRDLSSIGSPF